MFEAGMIIGVVIVWAIGFKLIFQLHERDDRGDDA